MVRASQRKHMINTLGKSIRQDIIRQAIDTGDAGDELSSDEDSDDEQDQEDEAEGLLAIFEDKVRALMAIEANRYLGPRARVVKGPEDNAYYLDVLEDKESFFNLCERLASNPIFHNNSTCPQRPVAEQMMVTLNRLGCHGNGVSVGMLATKYRIAEGTVELYTDRCLMAILGLKSDLLCWPDSNAHREVSEGFGEVGFDGCVGLIDGTLVVLSTCPGKDGADYYNRKGSYGITTLLACDQQKNIRYAYTGWPGCSHDHRLTNNSGLSRRSLDFFGAGEYLLADSVFTPTTTVVPAFKRARNRGLSDEEHDFNRHLSGVRVGIENCIGLLKTRFQSLKGLRLRATNNEDLVRVNAWIMACCVLHNFLNQGSDMSFAEAPDKAAAAETHTSDAEQVQPGTAAGNCKRREVLASASAFRESGGTF
ncbi:hypothetical protein PSTG_00569 [Puccinia striiformis f. sp. tritici PST-78]|uniref:DDE Tnp4 domain-containing protein n=1 Tax=Puccinia striiformis f. sp. tritici PST-78 TaxID=1165861 RepID=A0A0L0W3J8_9BASI|nr:hypothetical protein PSTG_00569 [Puccinia striiformis f. sp. tritici PST-78]